GAADSHLLRCLFGLRRGRAWPSVPAAWLQAVAAAALHPRGTPDRARDIVERARAAAAAAEARAARLQEGRRRTRAADGVFVQPRRYRDLPHPRFDVHRPGV